MMMERNCNSSVQKTFLEPSPALTAVAHVHQHYEHIDFGGGVVAVNHTAGTMNPRKHWGGSVNPPKAAPPLRPVLSASQSGDATNWRFPEQNRAETRFLCTTCGFVSIFGPKMGGLLLVSA